MSLQRMLKRWPSLYKQLLYKLQLQVIVSISVADADNADKITQQLIQSSNVKQITRQKTIVETAVISTLQQLMHKSL